METTAYLARTENGTLLLFQNEPYRFNSQSGNDFWTDGTNCQFMLQSNWYPEVTFANSPVPLPMYFGELPPMGNKTLKIFEAEAY